MEPSNHPASHKAIHLTLIIIGAFLLVVVVLVLIGSWLSMSEQGSGDQVTSQLQEAEDAYNQNDLVSAIAQVTTVINENPTNVTAYIQLSFYLSQYGSLSFKEVEYGEKAIVAANRAIELDKNNSEAWRALGFAHEIMQNYPDAHTAYGIAISHDSSNARAHFGNGHAYDLEGDVAQAEESYRNAIKLDSNLVEAHSGLGRLLVRQNKLDEAATEFKVVYDAAKNKRVKAEAAYSLGQIYRSQGNLIEAQKFAEEATVIDPIYPLAWYGAGAVYYSQAIDSQSSQTIEERASLLQKSTVMMNNSIGLNEMQTAAYLQLAINFSLIGKFDVCFEALDKAQTVVLSDITLTKNEKGEMIKRIQSVRDSLKVISETPLPATS